MIVGENGFLLRKKLVSEFIFIFYKVVDLIENEKIWMF